MSTIAIALRIAFIIVTAPIFISHTVVAGNHYSIQSHDQGNKRDVLFSDIQGQQFKANDLSNARVLNRRLPYSKKAAGKKSKKGYVYSHYSDNIYGRTHGPGAASKKAKSKKSHYRSATDIYSSLNFNQNVINGKGKGIVIYGKGKGKGVVGIINLGKGVTPEPNATPTPSPTVGSPPLTVSPTGGSLPTTISPTSPIEAPVGETTNPTNQATAPPTLSPTRSITSSPTNLTTANPTENLPTTRPVPLPTVLPSRQPVLGTTNLTSGNFTVPTSNLTAFSPSGHPSSSPTLSDKVNTSAPTASGTVFSGQVSLANFRMEYNINSNSADQPPIPPTAEDIQNLRNATEAFYLSVFNNAFADDPNKTVEFVYLTVGDEKFEQFAPSDETFASQGVIMDLQLLFENPVLFTSIPSKPISEAEALAVMAASRNEFEVYIMDYIRPIGGIFADTTHVVYQAVLAEAEAEELIQPADNIFWRGYTSDSQEQVNTHVTKLEVAPASNNERAESIDTKLQGKNETSSRNKSHLFIVAIIVAASTAIVAISMFIYLKCHRKHSNKSRRVFVAASSAQAKSPSFCDIQAWSADAYSVASEETDNEESAVSIGETPLQ